MVKKLSAVGNSPGLIIERPILELLNITKDTPLEVKTDGEALMKRNGRVPVLVPSPRLLHEMPLVPVPAAATFSWAWTPNPTSLTCGKTISAGCAGIPSVNRIG